MNCSYGDKEGKNESVRKLNWSVSARCVLTLETRPIKNLDPCLISKFVESTKFTLRKSSSFKATWIWMKWLKTQSQQLYKTNPKVRF